MMDFLDYYFGIIFGVDPNNTTSLFPNSSEVTETFYDLVVETQMCGWVGIAMLLSTLVMSYVFYYVIDNPRFNKLIHWILWLLLTTLVVFAISFGICQHHAYSSEYITSILEMYPQLNDGYDVYYETFDVSVYATMWSMLMTFMWSYLIRFKSINCRKLPF